MKRNCGYCGVERPKEQLKSFEDFTYDYLCKWHLVRLPKFSLRDLDTEEKVKLMDINKRYPVQ